ncbi:MAG: hypothetical protein AAF456_09915, partial [Planctomycetota bacterium]
AVGFVFAAFLFSPAMCSGDESRPRSWTIDSFEVEATLIDFNGTHVLLQDVDRYQEVFQVEQLSREDHIWLRSEVNALRLQVNRNRILRGMEIWQVDMVSASGQQFHRNYQAYDSNGAMTAAQQEFPSARIQSVSSGTRGDRGFRARVRNARLRQIAGRASSLSRNTGLSRTTRQSQSPGSTAISASRQNAAGSAMRSNSSSGGSGNNRSRVSRNPG